MAKDDVARELKKINSTLTELKSDFSVIKSDVSVVKSDLSGVKLDLSGVKSELSAAKIRDEEMLGKLKLGFEGLEGLRQSTEARFETVTADMREQTDLLKAVVVHIRRRVERVEARKPRRRS